MTLVADMVESVYQFHGFIYKKANPYIAQTPSYSTICAFRTCINLLIPIFALLKITCKDLWTGVS